MRCAAADAPGRNRVGVIAWCCQPPVLTLLTCCRADQSGCDRGCRRPKSKYEMGTTPAELTTVTTVAHTHFGPRTWFAGHRFRSMSAASLRMPSTTAVMASSLRVRPLRSLHCLLAAMPSSACTARSRWSHHTSVWHPHCLAILPKLPCASPSESNRRPHPYHRCAGGSQRRAAAHVPHNRAGERGAGEGRAWGGVRLRTA
jgi:hypothetical protein